MSQKKPLILDTAARKFFASQLLSCSVRQGRGIIHQELYNSEPINQVWVQGTVVLLSANGNDLLLDDGTGIIQATGVTEIVKDLFIHKGMYMMVAGQLRFIGSANEMQYSSIRVLKIADLSNNPHSEALWMAEVIEAQLQMKNRKSC